MENRQTVTVELGGEQRTLRYTLNSFALIKERIGLNLFDAGESEITAAMSDPASIRVLLWAGLPGELNLTPEQVGEWIDLGNLGTVSEKFAEALAASQQTQLGPPKGRQRTTTTR